MKSALVRTGSVPALSPVRTASSSSPNFKPFSGVFSGQKTRGSSPKISLQFEINQPKRPKSSQNIRRSFSENDIARSQFTNQNHESSKSESRFSPARIPAEEHSNSSRIENKNAFEISNNGGFSIDDLGSSSSITNTFYGDDRSSEIGAYYREMLKLNPSDSLLLRNYGRFLHEVENDTVRAEECYGRAILASPGDGELLSLYAKLVWETQRDEQRAKFYFDRAVLASPDDCWILGSYASFLWEVEAEEEEEGQVTEKMAGISPALETGVGTALKICLFCQEKLECY